MDKSLEQLIIHPTSRRIIISAVADKPHGILLNGEIGVGLKTIAEAMLLKWTKGPASSLTIEPNEKGSIGIEPIKHLYKQLKTKQSQVFAIIIDDADKMSIDAQNALLKLLEEPPANCHFILTSHHPELLLTTIVSRVQQINISKVDEQLCGALFPGDIESKKRAQISFLAIGHPAEIHRLINNDQFFSEQVQLMVQAREFINANEYDRLCTVAKLPNDRARIDIFLRMIGRLYLFSLDKNPKLSTLDSIDILDDTLQQIKQNGNIKLHLTNLSLRLGHM